MSHLKRLFGVALALACALHPRSTSHAQSSPQAPSPTECMYACGPAGYYDIIDCAPCQDWYDYGNWINSMVEYLHPYNDTRRDPVTKKYPVVFFFHGGSGNALHGLYEAKVSAVPADATVDDINSAALKNARGHSARVIKKLLENGYAVLVPYATSGLDWQTNNGFAFTSTSDYKFLRTLLTDIKTPTSATPAYLKGLDPTRMFATGMSDGGAQASRMAITWPDDFRAVVLNAGSWATCAADFFQIGACNVGPIPAKHPPILFLHAEADSTVTISNIELYAKALVAAGQESKMRVVVAKKSVSTYAFPAGKSCPPTAKLGDRCVDDGSKRVNLHPHDWLWAAPDEHVAWFNRILSGS